MNRLEFSLAKLAEEAAEVAHAALKANMFGMQNFNPMTGITNQEKLKTEIIDFYAAINLLYQIDKFLLNDEEGVNQRIVDKILAMKAQYDSLEEVRPLAADQE